MPYTPTSPRISPVVFEQVRRNLNREFAMFALLQEIDRLQALDMNSFTRPNQAVANSFARNVINAVRNQNNAAFNRAVAELPRVRRIGGGNIAPNKRARANAAATKIQALVRGIAGRKRAAARGSKYVIGPNGTIQVAVPVKRTR